MRRSVQPQSDRYFLVQRIKPRGSVHPDIAVHRCSSFASWTVNDIDNDSRVRLSTFNRSHNANSSRDFVKSIM